MTAMRPATVAAWLLTVIIGVIVGLSAGPAIRWVSNAIAGAYDARFPVVEMTGAVVAVRNNAALVHIKGTKLRDCKYLRMIGYVVSEDGQRRDVFVRRVGVPESGDTKSLGAYDIGVWEIGPLDGAGRVQIETRHLCGEHEVRTVVADVITNAQ